MTSPPRGLSQYPIHLQPGIVSAPDDREILNKVKKNPV